MRTELRPLLIDRAKWASSTDETDAWGNEQFGLEIEIPMMIDSDVTSPSVPGPGAQTDSKPMRTLTVFTEVPVKLADRLTLADGAEVYVTSVNVTTDFATGEEHHRQLTVATKELH